MKLIIHDVGDDYEHFGVHSPRTHRAVYVVDDKGRTVADFATRNLNQPISAHPEEVEMAKRFIDIDAAIAAAVAAEREACEMALQKTVMAIPEIDTAGLTDYEIKILCITVSQAAIRARNGSG